MPRAKKILTRQNEWTLILLGGLAFIYIFVHRQDFWPPVSSQVVVASIAEVNSDTLQIPSLQISAPIVYTQSTQEADIQTDLQSGVVHLGNTGLPGDVGNVYIVGHSSNYKNAPGAYNQIFQNLPNIAKGGQIIITHDKKQYVYVVYDTQVVESTELWVESQATDGAKILTLQTSYPVGTAQKRFVAIAKLQE